MIKKILISRVDNIGDVALTIPMAGYLSQIFPEAEIVYLVKRYTSSVCKLSGKINRVILWDDIEGMSKVDQINYLKSESFDTVIHVFPHKTISELCYQAKIPIRVGTAHRFFHWRYCNKLSFFSRKSSNLHEAQLNVKLLESIGSKKEFDVEPKTLYKNIHLNTNFLKPFENKIEKYVSKDKFNLILHPKSFGSALEWPLEFFRELADTLDSQKYNVIVTGTKKEEVHLEMGLLNPLRGKITSCVGELSLDELMALMTRADGIIAASTGPLHLGGLLGIHTLGLFPVQRPMFPLRWLPLGSRVSFLLSKKIHSMDDIEVNSVMRKIAQWEKLIND